MSTPIVAEYVLLPSGSTHLTDQSALLGMGSLFGSPKTLCGRVMPESTVIGDETLSGIAATCKTCKRILRTSNGASQ